MSEQIADSGTLEQETLTSLVDVAEPTLTEGEYSSQKALKA